jgi:hypothetical protein
MALHDRIAYLRTEHSKLRELADNLTAALALASSTEFADRQKSLARMRAFEHSFDGVTEHCHSEKRIVESIYERYLKKQECAQVRAEHQNILCTLGLFREELRFATADRTASLVGPGTELVRLLGSHLAREEEWLDRVAKSEAFGTRGKTLRPARSVPIHKQQPSKRRTRARREESHVPYTMEPHLEL